jgi:hypothetical protein
VPTATKPTTLPAKPYHLILLSTELDHLGIRLNTLAPHIDYLVILESPTTFTGRLKPLPLQANYNSSRFAPFHHQDHPPHSRRRQRQPQDLGPRGLAV